MAVKIRQQLSVFLENKPGVLTRLCSSLAGAKVNLLGISISDTVDHAVVRLIVSDPQKARGVFEEHGLLVVETDVLEVPISNKPGSLAKVTAALSKARINVEYAYGATGSKQSGTCLIFRVNNVPKALKALKT
jgi:hypothetical protein